MTAMPKAKFMQIGRTGALPIIAILAALLLSGCILDSPTGQVTAQGSQAGSQGAQGGTQGNPSAGAGTAGTGGTAPAADTTISIPLSEISAQAKWYEYNSNGVTIRFFAVKASDGSIKTAFDACDVCYGKHKGYRQEGNQMVCNNCGNRYAIDSLGTENKRPGGCWPGYLPSSVAGGKVIIQKSDLDAGRYRFA